MTELFAQQGPRGGLRSWDLQEWAVAIVIIAAVVGLVLLALRYFEVPIHPVAYKVAGILIVAVLVILAIRFLFTL